MLALLPAVLLLTPPPARAQDRAPIVHLTFERTLANSGSVGGEGRFEDYAEGEEAGYALGPWGWCLDNTAASRHGGSKPDDAPAGSAVAVEDPALDTLGSYTISCWFRQAPNATGNIARLFCKLGLLDAIPQRSGLSLGIGEGETKVIKTLPSASPMPLPGEWTFAAYTVDAQALKARMYAGTLTSPPEAGAEVEITPAPPLKPAPLTIGNAFSIRPFRGWVDNVRVFDSALAPEEVQAVYEADTQGADRAPLLAERVVPDDAPRRALFKPSDVCFSTRWQNEKALPVMEAFHVTRDLWTYGSKAEFVQQIRALGMTYEGTLNGMWASGEGLPQPEHEGDPTGRAYDLDGMKYVASWMRGWKQKVPNYIGCCNHPDFQRLFYRDADVLIDAGVDAIHVDDWAMNGTWCGVAGVCFCEHCMAGFRGYLREHLTAEQLAEAGIDNLEAFDYAAYVTAHDGVKNADDYRKRYRELTLSPHFTDFQIASVRRFFQEFSAHIDARAGRHVPISVNHQLGDGGQSFSHPYCTDLHDFQVGEKFRDDMASHVLACKLAEGIGMWQVISPIPRRLGPTYAGLATTYALGQLCLVPWDTYMGTEPNGPPLPRFFAAEEDLGPYYDLIHAHPELFDGYAAPALAGVLVNLDEPQCTETRDLCARLVELGVPYRVFVGAAKHARLPLSAEALAQSATLIPLSAPETFCPEDQAAIGEALATRCVRMLAPGADLPERLAERGLTALWLEGPQGVIAIPRVKPGPPFSAVIHVVNWNATPDGNSVEEYQSVTLALPQGSVWGPITRARWYEPGNPEARDLAVETHPDMVRITIPQLKAWAIVRVE